MAAVVPLATPPVRPTALPRRSLRLWRTRIGVMLVGFLILLAIGPFVAPYGPSTPVGVPNSAARPRWGPTTSARTPGWLLDGGRSI
jgi:hypothetical protein